MNIRDFVHGVFMNADNAESDIIKLEKEREGHVTKLFWLALQIAFIFLIPALIGVFISIQFFSRQVLWYVLPFTFIFSWVIVIIIWRKMNKILTKLDKDILELKKQNQHDRNN